MPKHPIASIFKRLDKKTVYHCPWLSITEHHFIGRGDHNGRYYTLEQADSVLVIPVSLTSRRTLLQQQERFPLNELSWEFPAGAIEVGEDPANAARRELWEETGIKANQLVELGWYYRVPGVSNQKTFFFIAPVSDEALDNATHAPLTDDIVALKVISLADCLDMAQTGLIHDAAVHLACLKLQTWLDQSAQKI